MYHQLAQKMLIQSYNYQMNIHNVTEHVDLGVLAVNQVMSMMPTSSLDCASLIAGSGQVFLFRLRRTFRNVIRAVFAYFSFFNSTSFQMAYLQRSFPDIDFQDPNFCVAAHTRTMLDFVVLLARMQLDKEWIKQQDLAMVKKAMLS